MKEAYDFLMGANKDLYDKLLSMVTAEQLLDLNDLVRTVDHDKLMDECFDL